MSAQAPSKIDRFAELLSQDLPIATIRQRLALTKSAAYGYLRRIRVSLGEQAR